ncbi:MAG: hypothetical protein R3Y59_06725 [bacterium]
MNDTTRNSQQLFESQINELVDKYKKLKGERLALSQKLKEAEDKLEHSTARIVELETNYKRLKLAKAYGWDETSKREANDRITKLVRDVEKCLKLLTK